MKLKCPKGCKVRKKAKFYHGWYVHIFYDKNAVDLGPDETSWYDCKDSYRCVKCHAEAVEIKK